MRDHNAIRLTQCASRIASLVAILTLTVSLNGCSSQADPLSSSAVAAPPVAKPAAGSELAKATPAESVNRDLTRGGVKPAKDDTLALFYGDDPDTLNLLTSNDTTSRGFQREVYESLCEQKFDNPDEWEPALAESYTFDKDKLEYTFRLRKGVK